MKSYLQLVASFAFVIVYSCGSKTISKGTCPCEISPLAKADNNVYYDVRHFDPKNKDCYTYLRASGKNEAMKYHLPVTIHFLDQVGSFVPPADSKIYGNEQTRKRVICQYILMANLAEMVVFDPFGYGTYVEPQ